MYFALRLSGLSNYRHAPRIILLGVLLVCTFTALGILGHSFNFDGQSQLALKRYGQPAQQTVGRWRDLLQSIQNAPDTDKIQRVNDFFNRRITFSDDIDVWNQSDYWATPLEFMGRGQGDCEDFAISKYFSLLILGIPADHLRITYVKARIGGPRSTVSQAHMVLGYYPNPADEPMILDNLLNDIRPASRRPDLTPVFSFNSEGLWVGSTPGASSSGSSTARLSRWRDLLSRMKADGFE